MIARLFAMILLGYAVGFILFAVTLGTPAPKDAARTDAIIVLTGGSGRIEHALNVLEQGKAKRLLIAGADPAVTKRDLAKGLPGSARLLRCCADLGSESVDTRSNAEEAKRWLERRKYRSFRLVTNDWHMRRARYEFRKVLGSRYDAVSDAVRSEPSFITLFGEYNKYVLRRVAVWLDI
ncbi:MAG TPA: YdcF family protein [Sphingomicrobium sp.]|nr:YdcF family protein [Sphingomicrobium sp.]